jgi:hypothetical protein
MSFIADTPDTLNAPDTRKRDERKKRVRRVGGVVLER